MENFCFVFLFLSAGILRVRSFHGSTQQFPSKPITIHRINSALNAATAASVNRITARSWDFIDDVFLVTTYESDPMRIENTKQELDKVGLWERVNIRKFHIDKEDKVRGCYTSHMKVLEEIERKNLKSPGTRRASLILEDNLEVTENIQGSVLDAIAAFNGDVQDWDVFHLAYMMYVPGLSLQQLSKRSTEKAYANNVVQMIAGASASVGTSAYIVSNSGAKAMLDDYRKNGFREAIPNVMAQLFPVSRYAAYPMLFHRAGKINSLVNPQLDDFRKVMFNPALYSNWERLMVSTGLQNNQLFPALTITLMGLSLYALYNLVMSALYGASSAGGGGGAGGMFFRSQQLASSSSGAESGIASLLSTGEKFMEDAAQLLVLFPLFVALWGASLFKPGNTGAGFAKSPASTASSSSPSGSGSSSKSASGNTAAPADGVNSSNAN